MKKFIIQTILLLIVIAVGLVFFNPVKPQTPNLPFIPQPVKQSNLLINGTTIKVEIADTPLKRAKGLGGRNKLSENEGMLFIFDKADKHPFWMKGLSFPLDFVWIKDDKIVDILENIQPPQKNTADAQLPIFSAKEPIDKVLELNDGTVGKLNIKTGDTVKLMP